MLRKILAIFNIALCISYNELNNFLHSNNTSELVLLYKLLEE